MQFEWDAAKDRLNKRLHGISFDRAREVFDDPFALSQLDQMVEGEERWWTIGRLGDLVVTVVVHTWMGEGESTVVRIISARKATPRERRFYEETET